MSVRKGDVVLSTSLGSEPDTSQRHGSSTQTEELLRSKLRDQETGQVVFTLSGRMQTEDIEQVQKLLVAEAPYVAQVED